MAEIKPKSKPLSCSIGLIKLFSVIWMNILLKFFLTNTIRNITSCDEETIFVNDKEFYRWLTYRQCIPDKRFSKVNKHLAYDDRKGLFPNFDDTIGKMLEDAQFKYDLYVKYHDFWIEITWDPIKLKKKSDCIIL